MESLDEHCGKRAAMQTSTLFLGSSNAIPHRPLKSQFKSFASDKRMAQISKKCSFVLPEGIRRPKDALPKNYFHALGCGKLIGCKALDELKVAGLEGSYFQRELVAIGLAANRGKDLRYKDPNSGIAIILPATTISNGFEKTGTNACKEKSQQAPVNAYWGANQLALIDPINRGNITLENGVYVIQEAIITIIHSPATRQTPRDYGSAPGKPHPEYKIAIQATKEELETMKDCEKRFNYFEAGILPVVRSGEGTIDSRMFQSASFADVALVLLEK